jgi:hypothetical protein
MEKEVKKILSSKIEALNTELNQFSTLKYTLHELYRHQRGLQFYASLMNLALKEGKTGIEDYHKKLAELDLVKTMLKNLELGSQICFDFTLKGELVNASTHKEINTFDELVELLQSVKNGNFKPKEEKEEVEEQMMGTIDEITVYGKDISQYNDICPKCGFQPVSGQEIDGMIVKECEMCGFKFTICYEL